MSRWSHIGVTIWAQHLLFLDPLYYNLFYFYILLYSIVLPRYLKTSLSIPKSRMLWLKNCMFLIIRLFLERSIGFLFLYFNFLWQCKSEEDFEDLWNNKVKISPFSPRQYIILKYAYNDIGIPECFEFVYEVSIKWYWKMFTIKTFAVFIKVD